MAKDYETAWDRCVSLRPLLVISAIKVSMLQWILEQLKRSFQLLGNFEDHVYILLLFRIYIYIYIYIYTLKRRFDKKTRRQDEKGTCERLLSADSQCGLWNPIHYVD